MSISSSAQPAKVFDREAQENFAQFSGDRNPVHMDAAAARRTQAGQPLVHGIHTVLWALERLADAGALQQPVAKLRVRFQKPIYVGENVTFQILRRDVSGIALRLCVDGHPVTAVDVTHGEMEHATGPGSPSPQLPPPSWPETPALPSLAEIENAQGWLTFAQDLADAARAYPSLSAVIGPRRVAALACLSRLVGMVCPGLYSTFFSLTIAGVEPASEANAVHYKVIRLHEPLRLVTQHVEGGGWSGVLESVARLPPVSQSPIETIAELVRSNEFSGTNALIVGGSRGLGEVTAKLIAAGGGSVNITYKTGHDDALDIQRQIRDWGGQCEILKYEADLPALEQLAHLAPAFSSVYYFATTPIFLRKTRLFSRPVFDKFCRLYVDGFFELCSAIPRQTNHVLPIFFPSSAAVEERPPGMTEYAMAKAAGEMLCADMAVADKGLRIIVERLPRMLTDQTATAMPVKSFAAPEIMLPIVRRTESRI